ncbi:hypothetical protein J6590_023994 [Homalodisca vitripennis]|nr:hypothetical protein J6590_023994 [Homalodisca vitripennis]
MTAFSTSTDDQVRAYWQKQPDKKYIGKVYERRRRRRDGMRRRRRHLGPGAAPRRLMNQYPTTQYLGARPSRVAAPLTSRFGNFVSDCVKRLGNISLS